MGIDDQSLDDQSLDDQSLIVPLNCHPIAIIPDRSTQVHLDFALI